MSDPVAADCPANYSDASVGIVVSDWQPEISKALLKQTVEKLRQCGVMDEDIYVSHVPGAMELPFGARQMNNMMEPSAVIMIGSIVRQDNPQFDFICQTVSRGFTHLNLHGDIPFIFGVVVADTLDEAHRLATDGVGTQSALAALKMVNMMATMVNQ